MSVSDYVLNEAVSGVASSSDFNENMHDIEDTNLSQFGHGVVSGAVGSAGTGLNVNITAGVFLLGVKLSKGSAVVPVPPSTSGVIWAVTDPDNADRVVYQVETGGATPSRATRVSDFTTDGSGVTSIANASGRVNLIPYSQALAEIIAARGSKASIDERLDIALNNDGTIKNGYVTEAMLAFAVATQAELDAHVAASDPHTVYQKESEKAAANGYASLDGSTLIPTAQIPPITEAMLAAALAAKLTQIEKNNQTGTTYTLVLSDAGKVVELNNASAITLTVPTNATVAFPVGTVIELFQQGAGQVTISPAGGVTIRSKDSNNKISGQYGAASLRKRDTDEWVLSGDITA